jgi:F-type H+-transporting ATPase subunit delta
LSKFSADLLPVAARYAKALFELASEKGQLDAVKKELDTVAKAMQENPEFRRFAVNPTLSHETQATVMENILSAMKVSDLTQRFFAVIAGNRRLEAVTLIAERFSSLLADSRGEATAEVISAYPLSAAQLKELKESLKKATGKADITLVTEEKPDILGGLIVKVDGKMFDNSIVGKITRLAASLKTEASA